MTTTATDRRPARVLLYWLPLGAGGHVVRWNGRIYEAISARLEHRAVQDLYHAALEVHVGGDRFVIEMAPVWAVRDADRGVVAEGPGAPAAAARAARSHRHLGTRRTGHRRDVELQLDDGLAAGGQRPRHRRHQP